MPRSSAGCRVDQVGQSESRAGVEVQIHAGGRGKGVFDSGFKGGVKICDTPQEVETLAAQMIGHRLISKADRAAGCVTTADGLHVCFHLILPVGLLQASL